MLNDGIEPSGNLFLDQIAGYRLTTAQILYHMPDHPRLLQEFVWQHLDIAPDFPVLNKFLTFWERQIEGRLHSVTVASADIVTPSELRRAEGLFALH